MTGGGGGDSLLTDVVSVFKNQIDCGEILHKTSKC